MKEEPCQCPDCQRFYKEHDRLIREFPTFKQQKEINWASIQSFRTLCGKVTEELQKKLDYIDDKAHKSCVDGPSPCTGREIAKNNLKKI